MFETLNSVNKGVIDSNLIPHYFYNSFDDLGRVIGQGPEENIRIYRRAPNSDNIVVAHQSRSFNVEPSGADGGILSKLLLIDREKKYRLSVWLKKSKTANNAGRVYFGLIASQTFLPTSGDGTSPTNVHFLGSNGTQASNPYFFFGFMPEEYMDEWILMVSFIRPLSDTTAVATPDTGMYTTDGVKLPPSTLETNPPNEFQEFRFSLPTQYLGLRAFMYYANQPNEFMETCSPRIDLVDGNEIPVEQLIADFTHRNLVKKGIGGYNSIQKIFTNHLNFNGVPFTKTNDSVAYPIPNHASNAKYLNGGTTGNGYVFVIHDLTLASATTVNISANATNGVIAVMVNDEVPQELNQSSGNIYNINPAMFSISLPAGTHRFSFYCCKDIGLLDFIATIKRASDNATLSTTSSAQLSQWKLVQ